MTAEIVNLRSARKRRNRAERETQAAENRALHGLPTAERRRQQAERDAALSRLDAHLLEPRTSPGNEDTDA